MDEYPSKKKRGILFLPSRVEGILHLLVAIGDICGTLSVYIIFVNQCMIWAII
jgi:hypothetical protein